MANKRRKILRKVIEEGYFILDGKRYTVIPLPNGNYNHTITMKSEGIFNG